MQRVLRDLFVCLHCVPKLQQPFWFVEQVLPETLPPKASH